MILQRSSSREGFADLPIKSLACRFGRPFEVCPSTVDWLSTVLRLILFDGIGSFYE